MDNVGELLGLDGDSVLLARAERRWPLWQQEHAQLTEVASFAELRTHLRAVQPAQADRCLLALAELAAHDGGDDVAAAAALAKMLLPGASVLAGRLTRSVAPKLAPGGLPSVNQVVASQLWIEVRTFPWRRLTRVGGNVLLNTRAAVLRELGVSARGGPGDRTWARTICLEADQLDAVLGEDQRPNPGLPPETELALLLTAARHRRVISDGERDLLTLLVREAAQVDSRPTERGRGNLCGNAVTLRVSAELGVSPATVRRRAARSIQALIEARPAEWCA